jgi:hypothetical protein
MLENTLIYILKGSVVAWIHWCFVERFGKENVHPNTITSDYSRTSKGARRTRDFEILRGTGHRETFQELRWVLQDSTWMKLPPPQRRRSTWKADWLRW